MNPAASDVRSFASCNLLKKHAVISQIAYTEIKMKINAPAVGERRECPFAPLGLLRRGGRVRAPDEHEPPAVVLLVRPGRIPLALLAFGGSHRRVCVDGHGAGELVGSLRGVLRERGAEEDGLEHQRGADAHENPGVG
jgi:hypothetical protein